MSNKLPKRIVRLDIPYPPTPWPAITPQQQAILLDLLSTLLQPVGHYRRTHILPSKGKRSRRRARKRATSNLASSSIPAPQPPAPAIAPHLTVGISATTRHLESLAFSASVSSAPPARLAAVFVPLSLQTDQPPLHLSHLPLLVRAASKSQGCPARLVSLPLGAEARLAVALGIPRVGCVGVMEGAPGARALLEAAAEGVLAVEVAWVDEAEGGTGRYLPPNVVVKEGRGEGKSAVRR